MIPIKDHLDELATTALEQHHAERVDALAAAVAPCRLQLTYKGTTSGPPHVRLGGRRASGDHEPAAPDMWDDDGDTDSGEDEVVDDRDDIPDEVGGGAGDGAFDDAFGTPEAWDNDTSDPDDED